MCLVAINFFSQKKCQEWARESGSRNYALKIHKQHLKQTACQKNNETGCIKNLYVIFSKENAVTSQRLISKFREEKNRSHRGKFLQPGFSCSPKNGIFVFTVITFGKCCACYSAKDNLLKDRNFTYPKRKKKLCRLIQANKIIY